MAAMVTISLLPIGAVDGGLIEYLEEEIGSIFGTVDVKPAAEVPTEARVPERGQLDGSSLFKALPTAKPGDSDAILGVVDEDIFVAETNFIFGLAYGNLAIISLTRLRQEFYGLSSNPALFLERAKKEAVHELGHVFGLPHCPDQRCVMYFSNSIDETDFKSWKFCGRCRKILEDSRRSTSQSSTSAPGCWP
jgi:archaemetzincin